MQSSFNQQQSASFAPFNFGTRNKIRTTKINSNRAWFLRFNLVSRTSTKALITTSSSSWAQDMTSALLKLSHSCLMIASLCPSLINSIKVGIRALEIWITNSETKSRWAWQASQSMKIGLIWMIHNLSTRTNILLLLSLVELTLPSSASNLSLICRTICVDKVEAYDRRIKMWD